MTIIEQQNIERTLEESKLSELSRNTEPLGEQERNAPLQPSGSDVPGAKASLGSALVIYGLEQLAESPEVRETISECAKTAGELIAEGGVKLVDTLAEVYVDVKNFFAGNDNDAKALEKLGPDSVEQRDFGLDKCTEAAKEIFTPGVIANWMFLSEGQRKEIVGTYAAAVSDAFELADYKGVVFKEMDERVLGQNNGDGYLYLNIDIISNFGSPIQVMNTITHELRHQYQDETIRGLHNVPDDVVKEWKKADQLYSYDEPSCFDPWGYTFNALELDARYAGETVVRNYTHDIINA